MKKNCTPFVALAVALVLSCATLAGEPAPTAPPFEVHYSPSENLEHIDVRLIDGAQNRIDAAIYVLSDWPIIDALKRAVARGVEVRVVLDRSQHHAIDRFDELEPWIRYKRSTVFMHLKSYSIDGAILRTGAANLSASGLKQQNNDMVILRSPAAVEAFEEQFDRLWSASEPIQVVTGR